MLLPVTEFRVEFRVGLNAHSAKRVYQKMSQSGFFIIILAERFLFLPVKIRTIIKRPSRVSGR
jgi:hypothetical protein